MDPLELTRTIHIAINVVVFIQIMGAVLTFTPMRERRRGFGSLYIVGFVVVLAGASRADLWLPAAIPGLFGLVAAAALFLWARIAIHGKMFSYILSTDVPQFACMNGPYRWIRHPFYASYMLTLLSVTLMFPSYMTAGGFILAFVSFNYVANFEEGKFKDSPVAAEYEAYKRRTGRFLPGLQH